MQKKWYLGTLLIILVVLGVVNQPKISAPNQEIVVQFADVVISNNNTQQTIASVKEELQTLGAKNIKVSQEEEGFLKITYFSTTDVSEIKETLSNRDALAFDKAFSHDDKPFQGPFQNSSIDYNIDIYEIQNGADIDWDFNGTLALQLEPKSDRFFNPDVLGSVTTNTVNETSKTAELSLKVFTYIALTIDRDSHNIPEVRAGPSC